MALDLTNKNNHAGIERVEERDKIEAMRKEINAYRLEMNMRQTVPTFMVIEWLCKFEKVLDEQYAKQIAGWELEKLRQDYFLVAKKKPFMAWWIEDLKAKIKELQEQDWLTDKSIEVKKSNLKETVYNHAWRKSNAYSSDYLDKKNKENGDKQDS